MVRVGIDGLSRPVAAEGHPDDKYQAFYRFRLLNISRHLPIAPIERYVHALTDGQVLSREPPDISGSDSSLSTTWNFLCSTPPVSAGFGWADLAALGDPAHLFAPHPAWQPGPVP